MSIRMVCLSDLHLGSEWSLLTGLRANGEPNARVLTPVLEHFAESLCESVRDLTEDDQRPTLVLLGDAIELAFTSTSHTLETFANFIRALYPEDKEWAFAETIYYVPGNHDHHEWRQARDAYYVSEIENAHDAKFPNPRSSTELFETPRSPALLLEAALRRDPRLRDLRIRIAYPNMGFQSGDRAVVMHHGHFTESMYRVVTSLDGILDPFKTAHEDIETLERQNGPWIDFLWSSFGDAKAVDEQTLNYYQMMQDPAATRAYGHHVVKQLFAYLGAHTSIHAGTTFTMNGISVEAGPAARAAYDAVVARAAGRERMQFWTVLAPATLQGLEWYLAGPVRLQIDDAKLQRPPEKVSFIFGHTHKPFQDQLSVAGYSDLVDVYNTGGWVLDDPAMSATQGANAVFIDDHAQVAALRLFNDDPNGALTPVRAVGVGGPGDEGNTLLGRLEDLLTRRAGLFQRFEEEVKESIDFHARAVREQFFDPNDHPATGPVPNPTGARSALETALPSTPKAEEI